MHHKNEYSVYLGIDSIDTQRVRFTNKRKACEYAREMAKKLDIVTDVYYLPPMLPHWLEGPRWRKQRIATYWP